MAWTVADVIAVMERIAPSWMAVEGDPVGLHAGDPARRVRRVLVALDATAQCVQQARARKCQMLITHHPRFYRHLDGLDESKRMGRLAADIARTRLAVYAAHTNLDAAPGGVNDTLADLAGLRNGEIISVHARDPLLKLVVFVPDSHQQAVRRAICEQGAGEIGDYSECGFRARGIGSFRGGESSAPFLGRRGGLEEVEEWRLEVILPASRRPRVERALLQAHPYEEPAYDFYRLEACHAYGCGRHGELRRPTNLAALARRMKRACQAPGARIFGDPRLRVRRVAVWSGGSCPVERVTDLGVQALVLGEIGYHDLEPLQEAGVGCVALGHGPSEEVVLEPLAARLGASLAGLEVEPCFHAPAMRGV